MSQKALLVNIVGTREIAYRLEKSTHYLKTYGTGENSTTELIRITPDITVEIKSKKGMKAAVKEMLMGSVGIAIELENDLHWDFQESLRQVKKYKEKFKDTRIIIPDDFKKFAPLYKHEGFRVYLWKARRRWQCLKCGTETLKEGPVNPKCSNSKCNNANQEAFRLVGLRDTKIEEYVPFVLGIDT